MPELSSGLPEEASLSTLSVARPSAVLPSTSNVPSERFTNIAGLGEVVKELQAVSREIEAWKKGDKNADLPNGILFFGNGSAKSMLARALAGESSCLFRSVSAHDLLEGENLQQKITKLFSSDSIEHALHESSQAKVRIVHIEDIDLLCPSRKDEHGELSTPRVLHALLSRMIENQRSPKERDRTIVTASADFEIQNFARSMFAPFDLAIQVLRPVSVTQRMEILKQIFIDKIAPKGFKAPSEEDLHYLARMTAYQCGASLNAILRLAARSARKDSQEAITLEHLVDGFQHYVRGNVHNHALSPTDKKRTLLHEDGHGVVAYICEIPPLLIAGTARGQSGGCVVPDPSARGEYLITKQQSLKDLLICFGGIASERINLGDGEVSDGATADIQKAQRIIERMLFAGQLTEGIDSSFLRRTSEAPSIPHAAIHLIENARLAAEGIIKDIGKELFEKMVEARSNMKGDLFGREAENFYTKFIPAEVAKKARSSLKRFLDQPCKQKTS